MREEYREATSKMEKMGVDSDYIIGWQGGLAGVDDLTFCRITVIVDIDIKPHSDPNCFNIKYQTGDGHGVIPVAILGSANFDVLDIDVTTLMFETLDVRVRGKRGPLCSIEDPNKDSFPDLVCHFQGDGAIPWTGGGDIATVTGELLDGTPIEGTDSICIVP